jgi:hypothetical protein
MISFKEILAQVDGVGRGIGILRPFVEGLAGAEALLDHRTEACAAWEARLKAREESLIERERLTANREASTDGLRQQLADEKARRVAAGEREARLALKLDEVRSEKNVLANQLGKIKTAFPQLVPTT